MYLFECLALYFVLSYILSPLPIRTVNKQDLAKKLYVPKPIIYEWLVSPIVLPICIIVLLYRALDLSKCVDKFNSYLRGE